MITSGKLQNGEYMYHMTYIHMYLQCNGVMSHLQLTTNLFIYVLCYAIRWHRLVSIVRQGYWVWVLKNSCYHNNNVLSQLPLLEQQGISHSVPIVDFNVYVLSKMAHVITTCPAMLCGNKRIMSFSSLYYLEMRQPHMLNQCRERNVSVLSY